MITIRLVHEKDTAKKSVYVPIERAWLFDKVYLDTLELRKDNHGELPTYLVLSVRADDHDH